MPRLGAHLGGAALWVKRDDATGLAFGGNKVRKLEYLLAEAQANGAHMLITTGAVQSNQCRQTAAAAARFGFDCRLVLAGDPPPFSSGNLLLDQLCGAEIIWSGDRDKGAVLDEVFQEAWDEGRRPYKIVYGASSPVGAMGFVTAMGELAAQSADYDRIIVASSSAGTQAGMIVGARRHGFTGRITGISVDQPAAKLRQEVAALAADTGALLEMEGTFSPDEVDVVDDYIGEGYAVLGLREKSATRVFARLEGLLLDPVYTAKAAAGMMDLIDRGVIAREELVLFWHTGGGPAIFAYGEALLQA
jgi:1-aminocyclopropane-1-carboxylate deaminase/D-cysteine desulfhydrase-like pyridoxal-dependent ACC family enzyme